MTALPCPFCGKPAKTEDETDGHTYAMCPNEDCAGGLDWIKVTCWNQRATIDIAAEVEE